MLDLLAADALQILLAHLLAIETLEGRQGNSLVSGPAWVLGMVDIPAFVNQNPFQCVFEVFFHLRLPRILEKFQNFRRIETKI
uniref:Uncharacterized protein n=1 Tax=Candidatus Kentrum sp. TC TaxID=2126339 RepID=A0A450Z8U8_9GAMM|nr:MAG: hypothetical protein BECKTC1821D_GA0114238_109417 [Candidatus Kentron sp. TC]